MSFDVKTDTGVVTANIAPGSYMDAGRSGEIAGLEFAATNVHAFDAPRGHRHAELVVTLDFTPETGRALATLLATKMGMPAFNEREWMEIADAIERAWSDTVGTRRENSALTEYATKIREAYS